MHKGMHQTCLAFKLPHGSDTPNAPGNSHSIALYEGGDEWDEMKLATPRSIAAINSIVEKGTFPLQTEDGSILEVPVVVVGGGDLKYIGIQSGVSGCNGSHPCPFCEVPNDSMCAPVTKAKGFTKRSVDRIALLSHTKLGQCPGCLYNIVEEITDPETQMLLASKTLAPPKVPKHLQKPGVTWPKLHCGIVFGHDCNFKHGPECTVICTLHLGLRIVGGLMTKTIFNKVDKVKARGVSQTDAIVDLLRQNNMILKKSKITAKSKNVDTAKTQFKKYSFAGKEAVLLMSLYPSLLVHTRVTHSHTHTHTHTYTYTHHTRAGHCFPQRPTLDKRHLEKGLYPVLESLGQLGRGLARPSQHCRERLEPRCLGRRSAGKNICFPHIMG